MRLDRTEIDQRPATCLEVLQRFQRPVDQPPEVGVEELAHFGHRYLFEPPVHADAGIVDPGIETTEPVESRLCDTRDVFLPGNVSHDRQGLAAGLSDLVGQRVQRIPASGRQHEFRTTSGRHAGRREADARRCAGDDDDLMFESFELDRHVPSFAVYLVVQALDLAAQGFRLAVPSSARAGCATYRP